MSEMHVRHCDCSECLPGFAARVTPTVATFARRNENGCRKRELFPRRYDGRSIEGSAPRTPQVPAWETALRKRNSLQ